MNRLAQAFLVVTLVTAARLRAQTPATGPTGTIPVGTGVLGRWVGESKCIGSQPACHDEHVIYQIDSVGPSRFAMEGFRVVGSDTIDMGPLSCQRATGDPGINCHIPQGVWRFSVVQGRLEGVLTNPTGTVARRAVADRAQP